MFTFGREHEKKHASTYLRREEDIDLMNAVIDAAHNLIDGLQGTTEIQHVLAQAMTEGRSGVWEQTIIWIRKLTKSFPDVACIWNVLAEHPSWKVRHRVAMALTDMPEPLAREIATRLVQDKSYKVRDSAHFNFNLIRNR